MVRLIRFLRSVKLGLILLAIIGVASIFGTLFPMEKSLRLVFQSWWYVSLLLLLGFNVSLATWHTLTVTIPADRLPLYLHRLRAFEALPAHRSVDTRAASTEQVARALDAATNELDSLGYSVRREGQAVSALRGFQSRHGAVISHLGLLVIIVGALLQAFLSSEGALTLAEGESSDWFQRKETRDGQPVGVREPLGASIALKDFEIHIHPQSGRPGKYTSRLAVTTDGETRDEYVEVNHSVNIAGYVLHQSSYRQNRSVARYLVALDYRDGSRRARVAEELNIGERKPLKTGDYLELLQTDDGVEARLMAADGSTTSFPVAAAPEGHTHGEGFDWATAESITVEYIRFVPSLRVGPGGKVASGGEKWTNPAVQILFYADDKPVMAAWLFYRPEFRELMMAKGAPCKVTLTRLLPEGMDEATPPEGVTPEDLRPKIELTDSETGERIATLTLAPGERVALPSLRKASVATPETTPEDGATTSATPPATGQAARYSLAGSERVEAYYSVMGITRNPGIGAIYLGCLLLSLGPIVAFSVRRRRVLVAADGEAGRLCAGGRARHYDEALRRDLDRLAKTMETAISHEE